MTGSDSVCSICHKQGQSCNADVPAVLQELKAVLHKVCKYLTAAGSTFHPHATLYLLSCPESSSVGLTIQQLSTEEPPTLSSYIIPHEVDKFEADLLLKVCTCSIFHISTGVYMVMQALGW